MIFSFIYVCFITLWNMLFGGKSYSNILNYFLFMLQSRFLLLKQPFVWYSHFQSAAETWLTRW